MKKKILLTALVVMAFVCLFAVSAFAEGIIVEKTEDAALGTIIKLSEDPGLDNAAQYASKLNNIEDSGDSAQDYCILVDASGAEKYYYVFPSSYIVIEKAAGDKQVGLFDIYADALVNAIKEFNTAKGTSYYADYVISGTGGNKKLDNIVRFEFPSDVTFISADYCCMRSYSNLVEVRFNRSVNVSSAEKLFQSCAKLQTVVGFEKVTGSMPKGTFMGCLALKTIELPLNVTKIPGSMFQNCRALKFDDFSKYTSLTTIDSYAFDGAQNLVIQLPDSVTTLGSQAFCSAFKFSDGLTINPTSQLKTLGYQAFANNPALTEIYIPSTVTSIDRQAFSGNSGLVKLENFENCQITTLSSEVFKNVSSLETLKIPKTVTTIEGSFYNNTALKLVYLPNSLTTVADTFTGAQAANAVYLFTGTDTSIFANCSRLNCADVILAKDYDETATYEGVNLVVGYSNCIAYKNGNHENYVSDEIIVGSYCEPIKVCNKCTDCNVIFGAGYELAAPFTYKGFSTDGESIVYDIKVNKEAIEIYNETTGGELKYGIVVSQIYNEGVLLDNEGAILDNKILAIKLSEAEFVSVQVKILNIAENLKTTPIHCCTYVVDNNEVKYIYDVKDEEGKTVVKAFDTANQVSYSQIAE